jgi:hypothetical protein
MSKSSEVLRRFLQADNLALPRHQTHNPPDNKHKHVPIKQNRPCCEPSDSDSGEDIHEHMRLPHKRVLKTHLSEAPDNWAALYHQLRQQRGFTCEYNDKGNMPHMPGRIMRLTRSNAHRHESTICIQGTQYKFTHDATQHDPTRPLTDQHDIFHWSNPPTNMVPTPPSHLSTASNCKPKLVQPKPLGLHTTFKKHVIRHTNHNSNGAVLAVVYADHAIPKAFLAEQWVAEGQKQLLTTWEPHVVMRKHLALWATRGYTPKRVISVDNKVSPTDNNTRKHWSVWPYG